VKTNRKVVVADDEPRMVELAATNIALDGWQVITAESGAQAFDNITSEKPWSLIVGETLTDMAGHHLLQRLVREVAAEDRPSILMLLRPYSGGGFGRWSEFGEAAHMPDMYLTKPFNPLELRSFVNRLYEQHVTQGPRGPVV
jgi:DNA-binding response OmpR family regulator